MLVTPILLILYANVKCHVPLDFKCHSLSQGQRPNGHLMTICQVSYFILRSEVICQHLSAVILSSNVKCHDNNMGQCHIHNMRSHVICQHLSAVILYHNAKCHVNNMGQCLVHKMRQSTVRRVSCHLNFTPMHVLRAWSHW